MDDSILTPGHGPSTEDEEFEGHHLEHAILVGTYQKNTDKTLCSEHLEELADLAQTFGIPVVTPFLCMLRKRTAATYLGKGKIEELEQLLQEKGAELIIFDEDILPSQQKNLEERFKCPVLDRTEVILDVFAQRAQTHEARLQIELAQVKYQFPRLKRLWTHLSRQRGGGMYLKGEGEKQIEIDRRLLQTRLDRLEKDLAGVRAHRETQRQARIRSGIPSFAIVGYTNVGKSTLMNALTEAEVLVEDKLFATLDTTTRKYTLPNNQDILLIDTVGFIRKLPHHLVAAFRSTLEESLEADILLHLIDVTHPSALEQAEETLKVIRDLGAADKPMITVFNKVDLLDSSSQLIKWRSRFSHSVAISAQDKQGFEDLLHMMMRVLQEQREEVRVRIPQKEYALVSELTRIGKVLHQDYEDNDVFLRIEIPKRFLYRVQPYLLDLHE